MQFKEDCNTEKKIIAKLKNSSERSLWAEQEDKIKRDLFDLIQVT
jgi:4-alpha-glucanotransferase